MLKELKLNHALWLATFLVVFVWSAIAPKDTFTWFLEVVPAIIGIILMTLTFRSFHLTSLLYFLILIHCIILMVGGHYTYAEVPLFDWLSLEFEWSRNNYDKLGHFAQGFVPVLIAREILIRKQVINGIAWTNFFSISVALAFSAFYELIEWWVALGSDEAADAFLGTQGYIWDTQSDMGWALLGAILSIIFLSRWHNHQIKALTT